MDDRPGMQATPVISWQLGICLESVTDCWVSQLGHLSLLGTAIVEWKVSVG